MGGLVHVPACRARSLDVEYQAVLSQEDPSFDFNRLPTVLELTGKMQDEYIHQNQNKLQNAQKMSDAAAWECFTWAA